MKNCHFSRKTTKPPCNWSLPELTTPGGTNGILAYEGVPLCHTIELPWNGNRNGISCIPEGMYALAKRYSPHLQWHLEIKEVPGRQYILIHPANDAMKELRGCIASVAALTAPGCGLQSRAAFNRLIALLFPALDQPQEVWLVIQTSGGR